LVNKLAILVPCHELSKIKQATTAATLSSICNEEDGRGGRTNHCNFAFPNPGWENDGFKRSCLHLTYSKPSQVRRLACGAALCLVIGKVRYLRYCRSGLWMSSCQVRSRTVAPESCAHVRHANGTSHVASPQISIPEPPFSTPLPPLIRLENNPDCSPRISIVEHAPNIL
jgi:hypothetical protein